MPSLSTVYGMEICQCVFVISHIISSRYVTLFFLEGGGGGAAICWAEIMRNLWKFFIAYPTFLSVLRWYGQCLQLGDAAWLLPQT